MQNSSGLNHSKSKNSDGIIRKNLRRVLTGISFIVFGLGSLDLAFAVLPLIIVFSPNKEATP